MHIVNTSKNKCLGKKTIHDKIIFVDITQFFGKKINRTIVPILNTFRKIHKLF